MKYAYTLLKQDGTTEDIGTFDKELSFKSDDDQKGLYDYLKCNTIEIIPTMYYDQQDWVAEIEGKITCFGDEEGRFNSDNKRNPHFAAIFDADNQVWDVVGDIVRVVEL